jgi:REP element-mobilizing transposase RayT
VPDHYISLLTYLFTQVLDGRNESLTNDVQRVLGRAAIDFSEYARKVAATGIWNPQNELI